MPDRFFLFVARKLSTAIQKKDVTEQKRWITYSSQIGQYINRNGINTAAGVYKLELHENVISKKYHAEAFHARDEYVNPDYGVHGHNGLDKYASCTWANEGKIILLDQPLQELPQAVGGGLLDIAYNPWILETLVALGA